MWRVRAVSFIPRDTHHLACGSSPMMGIARPISRKREIGTGSTHPTFAR
jgi:hypothetical protein